jgi:hypothetical protein
MQQLIPGNFAWAVGRRNSCPISNTTLSLSWCALLITTTNLMNTFKKLKSSFSISTQQQTRRQPQQLIMDLRRWRDHMLYPIAMNQKTNVCYGSHWVTTISIVSLSFSQSVMLSQYPGLRSVDACLLTIDTLCSHFLEPASVPVLSVDLFVVRPAF